MHYYIDGYNLLFYLLGVGKNDLKSQRDRIIQTLNIKIESLALDLTLVFDSHLSPGDASRSHFHHLEVLYTPEGVTADDFIIQLLEGSKDATKEVVVTNDKELSMRAKHQYASTQSLENFLNWLNRRYSNQTKKKGSLPGKIQNRTPLVSSKSNAGIKKNSAPPPRLTMPLTSKNTLKLEPPPRIKLIPLPESIQTEASLIQEEPNAALGSFDFYLSQFQTAHEKNLEQEKHLEQEKKANPVHKKKKHTKKDLASLFQEPSKENLAVSDMERWLKIFEDRNKNI